MNNLHIKCILNTVTLVNKIRVAKNMLHIQFMPLIQFNVYAFRLFTVTHKVTSSD